MARKKKDCASWLLEITNPFSIYRKKAVLAWAVMVTLVFCGGMAALMYYLNTMGHGGR